MMWRRWEALASLLASFALALGAWEVLARAKSQPRLYPTVGHIVTVAFPSLATFSGTSHPDYVAAANVLCSHTLITVRRISFGVLLGVPAGIVAGLLVHGIRRVRRLTSLALTTVRAVPLLALIPLFSYWFGTSELASIMYIAFGTFVVFASDTYEAAMNVNRFYVMQARLLGGGAMSVALDVYWPAMRPQLLSSVVNVVGLSWAFALGAEYICATSGLGYLAYQSYLYADTGKLTVVALTYVGLGLLSYWIGSRYLRRAIAWHNSVE